MSKKTRNEAPQARNYEQLKPAFSQGSVPVAEDFAQWLDNNTATEARAAKALKAVGLADNAASPGAGLNISAADKLELGTAAWPRLSELLSGMSGGQKNKLLAELDIPHETWKVRVPSDYRTGTSYFSGMMANKKTAALVRKSLNSSVKYAANAVTPNGAGADPIIIVRAEGEWFRNGVKVTEWRYIKFELTHGDSLYGEKPYNQAGMDSYTGFYMNLKLLGISETLIDKPGGMPELGPDLLNTNATGVFDLLLKETDTGNVNSVITIDYEISHPESGLLMHTGSPMVRTGNGLKINSTTKEIDVLHASSLASLAPTNIKWDVEYANPKTWKLFINHLNMPTYIIVHRPEGFYTNVSFGASQMNQDTDRIHLNPCSNFHIPPQLQFRLLRMTGSETTQANFYSKNVTDNKIVLKIDDINYPLSEVFANCKLLVMNSLTHDAILTIDLNINVKQLYIPR